MNFDKSKYLYHPKIRRAWDIGEVISLAKKQDPLFKVGFTNGKFRILTPAHIVFLNLCKTQCNLLVVAVNSDLSLRELDSSSPYSDRERAFSIASLECVDYVTIFDEENPYKTISEVNPIVVFKGNDYDPKNVISAGREVEIIQLPEFEMHASDVLKDKPNKFFKV